ncbi:MAG TPA: hypothetical protein VIM49_07100 [Dermatophilaceae bacterium]
MGTPRSGILVAVVIVAATTSVVLVAGVSCPLSDIALRDSAAQL